MSLTDAIYGMGGGLEQEDPRSRRKVENASPGLTAADVMTSPYYSYLYRGAPLGFPDPVGPGGSGSSSSGGGLDPRGLVNPGATPPAAGGVPAGESAGGIGQYISPHYTGVAPGSGLGYGGAPGGWYTTAWEWMKENPEKLAKLYDMGKGVLGGGGDYPGGGVNTYGDASKMPGFYQMPPEVMAQLFKILSDPYGADITAAKTRAMKGTEQAYDTAGQRLRSSIFGSGAEGSGVARGEYGNLEAARGEALAQDMADWEEFRLMLGDERLRTLLMPYLQAYNQAYGTAMGTPTYKQPGDSATDWIDTAIEVYKLFS